MKRLLIAVFAVSTLAAGAAILALGPNIEFKKTTHDFGKIAQGKPVAHEFTFTNTGDEPLVLIKVKASCGCTTPSYPREPIAPGAEAQVVVEFNSKGKKGKRNQKVTITANTNPPQTFIYLTGEVLSTEAAPNIQVTQ